MASNSDSRPLPPLHDAAGDTLCVACFLRDGKNKYSPDNSLRSHYRVHKGCNLECGKCPNKFASEVERELHRQQHHQNN